MTTSYEEPEDGTGTGEDETGCLPTGILTVTLVDWPAGGPSEFFYITLANYDAFEIHTRRVGRGTPAVFGPVSYGRYYVHVVQEGPNGDQSTSVVRVDQATETYGHMHSILREDDGKGRDFFGKITAIVLVNNNRVPGKSVVVKGITDPTYYRLAITNGCGEVVIKEVQHDPPSQYLITAYLIDGDESPANKREEQFPLSDTHPDQTVTLEFP